MTQDNLHVWVIFDKDQYRCVNCDIKHSPDQQDQECPFLKPYQPFKYKEAFNA